MYALHSNQHLKSQYPRRDQPNSTVFSTPIDTLARYNYPNDGPLSVHVNNRTITILPRCIRRANAQLVKIQDLLKTSPSSLIERLCTCPLLSKPIYNSMVKLESSDLRGIYCSSTFNVDFEKTVFKHVKTVVHVFHRCHPSNTRYISRVYV